MPAALPIVPPGNDASAQERRGASRGTPLPGLRGSPFVATAGATTTPPRRRTATRARRLGTRRISCSTPGKVQQALPWQQAPSARLSPCGAPPDVDGARKGAPTARARLHTAVFEEENSTADKVGNICMPPYETSRRPHRSRPGCFRGLALVRGDQSQNDSHRRVERPRIPQSNHPITVVFAITGPLHVILWRGTSVVSDEALV